MSSTSPRSRTRATSSGSDTATAGSSSRGRTRTREMRSRGNCARPGRKGKGNDDDSDPEWQSSLSVARHQRCGRTANRASYGAGRSRAERRGGHRLRRGRGEAAGGRRLAAPTGRTDARSRSDLHARTRAWPRRLLRPWRVRHVDSRVGRAPARAAGEEAGRDVGAGAQGRRHRQET